MRGALYAVAAISALAAAVLALPGAEAHEGTITVSSAAIVGPHSIDVVFTDRIGYVRDGTDAQQNALYSNDPSAHAPAIHNQMKALYNRAVGGDSSACPELKTMGARYSQLFYSNVVLSPGGAKQIYLVEPVNITTDRIHLNPCENIPRGATATLHIADASYGTHPNSVYNRQFNYTENPGDYFSFGWIGTHGHDINAATIHVIEGRPPVVLDNPLVNVNTGRVFFHFDGPGANGSLTDPSKITIGGVNMAGAYHTTTTGAVSLTLHGGQREALAEVQDTKLTKGGAPVPGSVVLAAGAFARASGHATEAVTLTPRVIKDTSPPELSFLFSEFDLGHGLIKLRFDEPVSTSADLGKTRMFNSGAYMTLAGASIQESAPYSERITIQLTPSQKATIMDPGSFPPRISYGFRDQASFPDSHGFSNSLRNINMSGGAFSDAAGIAARVNHYFGTIASVHLDHGFEDRVAPRVLAQSLYLGNDGELRITLDEYVRARSADLTGVSLSGSGQSVSLSAASSLKSNGEELRISLTEEQRQSAIGMGARVDLGVRAGALNDLAGNPIAQLSGAQLSLVRDGQGPSFVSASLDDETGALTVTFDEKIDVTPASRVDQSGIVICASGRSDAARPADGPHADPTVNRLGICASGHSDAVRLSGQTVLGTSADAATVRLTLTEAQRSAVSAYNSGSLVLEMDAGAVRDTSGNPSPQLSEHLNASADRTAPSAQSASIDLGTGELSVTFDETVDATPAYRVDLSRVKLHEAGSAAMLPLSGAQVSEADSPVVRVTLTESQRQQAVSYASGLSLTLEAGAVHDAARNMAARTAGLSVSVSAQDETAPSLSAASLDGGTGVLTLLFDETADASAADTSKMWLKDRGSADAARLSLSSASSVSAHDAESIEVTLSGAQRQAALAFADLLLDLDAGAAADTSGNPIAAARDAEVGDRLDAVAPSLVSASLSGPKEVRVFFSEDLLDSSVQQSDFEVSAHTVSSVSESAGAVTIGLAEPVSPDSGETVRVTTSGPVSDLAGNELAAGAYHDVLNNLDFAEIREFTVTSSNENNEYAKSGDTVTLKFAAKAAIDIDGSTVTVNSQSLDLTRVAADEFTATYAVAGGDGPLEIEAQIKTPGDNPTVAVFDESDLWSVDSEGQAGPSPNVTLDNTAPRFLSGSLAGFASIYVHYTEEVVTEKFDYSDIQISGGGTQHEPSSVSGSGESSHILVMWQANYDERVIGREIGFTVGPRVQDLAGNDIANPARYTVPAVTDADALSTIHLTSGPSGQAQLSMPHDTLIRNVHAGAGTVPTLNVENFQRPGVSHLPGNPSDHIAFPPGDPLVVHTQTSSVTFPPDVHVAGFDEDLGHTIRAQVSEREPDADFVAAHPHIDTDSAHILEFGHPDVDLTFSHPVKVDFKAGIGRADAVFSIDSAGSTLLIADCGSEVYDAGAEKTDPRERDEAERRAAEQYLRSDPAELKPATVDGGACVERERSVIWTLHFSSFGSASPVRTSSECDDCTAPTLGLGDDGARIVSGGFSYNGHAADVGSFFTDYPQITAQVGVENTATLKVYDEGGTDQVRHAAIAFGLRSGQSISESRAEISWDRDHAGIETVTVTDPHNALEGSAVSVSASEAQCRPGSTDQCLSVSITHSFRAPLDFDMVGTNVWDADRNGRQNYFNHGIHIEGESLNEIPGMLVDGLRLYPIRAGSDHVTVMTDGDGQLYRLAPDGTYKPLTNQSALHMSADELWWVTANIDDDPMGGYDRYDPRFAGALALEELAALEVLGELTGHAPLSNPDFGAPAPLVYHEQTYSDRSSDEALGAAILAERERAALLYEALFGDGW